MKWDDVERVLCIRLDSMGDVLMTSPALKAASDEGRRQVTLLTSSSGVGVARYIPGVSDVVVYDSPWMKLSAPRPLAKSDRATLASIEAAGFDAAIIFTVFSQSALPAALLCYYAGIPLRLAYARENPYSLLTDWVPEREPDGGIRHEVTRQLDLVRHVGWSTKDDHLGFTVLPETKRSIDRIRERHSLQGRWMVIHPGASASSRRYPQHLFAEVAQMLVQHGIRLAFTGTSEESGLIEDIRRGLEAETVSLAGLLQTQELAALLQCAPLLLCNNTGPAHLAAAVRTPVVDLYALTNPQHTPWNVPSIVLSHDVPCRNCFKSVCPQGHNNCLSLITPETVVQACISLLGQRNDRDQERQHANARNQCRIS